MGGGGGKRGALITGVKIKLILTQARGKLITGSLLNLRVDSISLQPDLTP